MNIDYGKLSHTLVSLAIESEAPEATQGDKQAWKAALSVVEGFFTEGVKEAVSCIVMDDVARRPTEEDEFETWESVAKYKVTTFINNTLRDQEYTHEEEDLRSEILTFPERLAPITFEYATSKDYAIQFESYDDATEIFTRMVAFVDYFGVELIALFNETVSKIKCGEITTEEEGLQRYIDAIPDWAKRDMQ